MSKKSKAFADEVKQQIKTYGNAADRFGGVHPGRPKGLQNKTTILAKDAIAWASEEIGGKERLAVWIKEHPDNEYVFWSVIYPKLLPTQLSVNGQINLTATKEQRDATVLAFARSNT